MVSTLSMILQRIWSIDIFNTAGGRSSWGNGTSWNWIDTKLQSVTMYQSLFSYSDSILTVSSTTKIQLYTNVDRFSAMWGCNSGFDLYLFVSDSFEQGLLGLLRIVSTLSEQPRDELSRLSFRSFATGSCQIWRRNVTTILESRMEFGFRLLQSNGININN